MEGEDKLQVYGVTDLNVRVEEHPDLKDKRAHVFRALSDGEKAGAT